MFRVEDHTTFIIISPVRTLIGSASLTDIQLLNLLKWTKEHRPDIWKEAYRND